MSKTTKPAGIGSVTIVNGKHFGWVGMKGKYWDENFMRNGRVYIGRSSKALKLEESPLANPFKVKQEGRKGCINKFRRLLWEDVKSYRETKFSTERLDAAFNLADMVKLGGDIELVCHCAPEGCHGSVIKNFIYWVIKENIH